VYVVDVNGTPLALTIFGIEEGAECVSAEFDEVLASMQIEP